MTILTPFLQRTQLHSAHVLAYAYHRNHALNREYSTEEHIWQSWAIDLSVDQVQDELAEIGRVVTEEFITSEYRRHDADYAAECKARGGHYPGSIFSNTKVHLFC
jgi:hypothetical protein